MPLDEKARLKLETIRMTFGSQMHALERNTGDQAWREYREEAWTWSITKGSALVDHLYSDEKAGVPATHHPAPIMEKIGETDIITVKSVTLQSSGTSKQGRPWKLYKITDHHDQNYFSFHTSFQLGETYEIDWEWHEKDGKRSRTIKETPRPVRQPGDEEPDNDIPF